jgi:two-component system CheB/CheR fusion protein
VRPTPSSEARGCRSGSSTTFSTSRASLAGKLKLDQGPVDLCAVVRGAVEGVAGVAEAKGLTFHVELDETLGPVSGDPTRLQQVVTNLLANAVKFSFENGKVTVLLDRHDGHARLRVGDTGVGIEPEFLPHVFRRFAQEDGTTVRKHGGLGLGLAHRPRSCRGARWECAW